VIQRLYQFHSGPTGPRFKLLTGVSILFSIYVFVNASLLGRPESRVTYEAAILAALLLSLPALNFGSDRISSATLINKVLLTLPRFEYQQPPESFHHTQLHS
jgi:hypothetical protein